VQYGKSIRYVGHATSFDDVIIQGSTQVDSTGGGLGFVAYYLRKDKVVAVCSLGKDPVTSHASELMRLGKMPTGEEVKSGVDILTIPLKSKSFLMIGTEVFKVVEKKNEELNWVFFIALPLVIFVVSGFFLTQQ
jgi:hypothetical protein